MIKQNCNKIYISFLLCTFSAISPAQNLSEIKIGIVHSEKTRQLFHKNDNTFNPILDWELFFLNLKLPYETFEDRDLDNLEFMNTDVLILPSVEILSDSAMGNIRKFMEDGGNLFVLGRLGSVDNELNVRKPDALEKLTGLKTSQIPAAGKISEYHLIGSSNILTQDNSDNISFLVINQLMPLFVSELPYSARVLGSYELTNLTDRIYPGMVSLELENARLFWAGFQISQIASDVADDSAMGKIFMNAISWLAGKPSAWINCFPSFHRSVTFVNVLTNNLESTVKKLPALNKEGEIKLNFFITASELLERSEILHTLSSAGEINLMFDWLDYLADDSISIEKIFSESSDILKNKSSQKYFGLQIQNAKPDKFSVLKSDTSFDYILTPYSNIILLKNHKELTSLKKNIINEINTNGSFEKKTPGSVYELYSGMKYSGGILTHIYKEIPFDDTSRNIKENIEYIIAAAKNEESHISTYANFIDWIYSKKDLSVSVEEIPDESGIILKLKNSGNKLVEDIGLIISIPSTAGTPELTGYNFQFSYNTSSGYYNMLVPFIHAGEELIFEINYLR